MKITKQNVWDWVEDKSTIEIDKYPTKHDYHATVYVTKKDDKFWRYALDFSYSDGLQFYYDIEPEEVKPIEKTVITWEKV